MRKPAKLLDGNSMWRWLLLAVLLTGIVSQNFNPPRSIYRIEEVVAGSGNQAISAKTGAFFHSSQKTGKQFVYSNKYRLQCERLRFLSQSSQIHADLAISTAPNLLPILMRATGRHLKIRRQSSEEPFHFLS
ncbi:hypothetical protein [Dyadobacter psychrophilus]|uniref:hypothetical protein n=1 Tax=Dyadobacter psychrophilus TaxID=651661 RepID=UPI001130592B|nr:hypothetical protein [Dyadobacter psychrophilus]